MNRRMARAVYRLFLIFGAFAILVAGFAAYWQVVAAPRLREDPRNPRLRLSAGLPRGGIVSDDGEVLVRSVRRPDGSWERVYLGSTGLASAVGYVSERLGESGLEAACDAHLRGTSVEAWLARLAGLRRTLAGQGEGPLPDLRLTIRMPVQRAAELALGGRAGAVVALDPRSGAILALASAPGFRPDRIDREWDALRDRPDAPLLNRALAGLYPPGSAFKPAVALAVLEERRATPAEQFFCTGRRKVRQQVIRDLGGAVHGRLDLDEAMRVSCNFVFSGLAMRLSPGYLAEAAKRYGLLAPPGLGLPGEAGRFPAPGRLDQADLAELGIGQGSLLVTPLGLARFAAVLANRGRRVEPYLVESLGFPGARTVSVAPVPAGGRVASPAAVAAVDAMLADVVASGTGRAAQVPGVTVAGKTGSAENPHGAPHAVFLGFAPVEAPEVAVAVVLENGGLGGEVAAPVARRVIEAALRH